MGKEDGMGRNWKGRNVRNKAGKWDEIGIQDGIG
jgi:hypothetical protein